MAYVLDTNIFDWLSKGWISLEDLPHDDDFYVLHVQKCELENNMPFLPEKIIKKEQSIIALNELVLCPILEGIERRARQPISSPLFMFDIPAAGFDEACWADKPKINRHHRIYAKTKKTSDKPEKEKHYELNATYDALIGGAALDNGYTLLTTDKKLHDAVKDEGGEAILFRRP